MTRAAQLVAPRMSGTNAVSGSREQETRGGSAEEQSAGLIGRHVRFS